MAGIVPSVARMTILITGATGNVGRPLVSQLLSAGHSVRALTRDPSRADLPTGVDVVAGNLDDTESLRTAFEGVDAVHLIGFGADYEPLRNAAEIVALAEKSGVRKATLLRDLLLGELHELHRSPDRRERDRPEGEDVCPMGEGERGGVRAMSTLRPHA
jgi:uncharacterized protein YbjT (DUF2867 family)